MRLGVVFSGIWTTRSSQVCKNVYSVLKIDSKDFASIMGRNTHENLINHLQVFENSHNDKKKSKKISQIIQLAEMSGEC